MFLSMITSRTAQSLVGSVGQNNEPNEIYSAVLKCTAEDGRKRCELFRDPPSRQVRLPSRPLHLSGH